MVTSLVRNKAMEVGPVVVAAAVLLIIWLLKHVLNFVVMMVKLSPFAGPPRLPVIGNLLQSMVMVDSQTLTDTVMLWCDKCRHDEVIRIQIFHQNYFVLMKPDLIQQVLVRKDLITKSFNYDFLHPWLKTGLLTSTGSKWHSRRKLLTPSFHLSILNDFIDVFVEHSNTLVGKLRGNCGHKINMSPFVTLCALDAISETAMGLKINAQDGTGSNPYVQSVYDMTETLWARMNTPFMWPHWIFSLTPTGKKQSRALKIVHDFTRKVIVERKQEQKPPGSPTEGKKRMAFLDLLLHMSGEDGRAALDMADIQEEVDTFMFEGHDTTSATVCWALHFIAVHHDIQERLYLEQRDIFGDEEPEHVSPESLRKMEYLERVVKETLRLFPPIPFVGRAVTADTRVTLLGIEIPVGSVVMVVTPGLHRDPHTFPDPERFDPDRFLPENCVDRHPFAYIPFSAGPRNCIGQRFAMLELKVFLSAIVRNFRVSTEQTRSELRPLFEVVNRPQNGILVTLSERK